MKLQSLAVATYAALEQRRDAEPLRDGRGGDVLALEAEGRGAGDDLEARYATEAVEHLLGETVGEILLVRVAGEVLERQHGDGRILGRPGLADVRLADEQHDDSDEQCADHDRVGVVAQAAHRGTGDARRGGIAFDAVWPDLEEPGERDGEREPGRGRDDEGRHHPTRGAQRFERDVGDLQQEPGDDRVARRDAQHAAFAQALQPAGARANVPGRIGRRAAVGFPLTAHARSIACRRRPRGSRIQRAASAVVVASASMPRSSARSDSIRCDRSRSSSS